MKLRTELSEGEMIPKGYGIAYRRLDRLTAILYPVPLNMIVTLLNRFWVWLKHGGNLYNNGFHKGYDDGYTNGRDYAFNQYKEQVKRQEIENILKNFTKYQQTVVKKHLKGQNIDGWYYKFIEKETKRITL